MSTKLSRQLQVQTTIISGTFSISKYHKNGTKKKIMHIVKFLFDYSNSSNNNQYKYEIKI